MNVEIYRERVGKGDRNLRAVPPQGLHDDVDIFELQAGGFCPIGVSFEYMASEKRRTLSDHVRLSPVWGLCHARRRLQETHLARRG